MAYPTVDQSYETRFTPIESLDSSSAADGTQRATTRHTSTVYTASLVHPLIDSTDKDLVMAHYAANKSDDFSVTRDANNTAYTMIYLGEPEVIKHNAAYWTVISKLRGIET